MDFLCKLCDREILEDENDWRFYLATFRKTYDRCLYTKYTINNVDLDEFDKILKEYNSRHNKNFDL